MSDKEIRTGSKGSMLVRASEGRQNRVFDLILLLMKSIFNLFSSVYRGIIILEYWGNLIESSVFPTYMIKGKRRAIRTHCFIYYYFWSVLKDVLKCWLKAAMAAIHSLCLLVHLCCAGWSGVGQPASLSQGNIMGNLVFPINLACMSMEV